MNGVYFSPALPGGVTSVDNADTVPQRSASTSENRLAALEKDAAETRKKLRAAVERNRVLRETVTRLRQQAAFLEEKHQEALDLLNQDPYTGLPIRRLFLKRLDERIQELKDAPNQHRMTAVGVIRLDNAYARIKNSRDSRKILLYRTSARIREVIGDSLFQSDRIDEFNLILNNMPNLDAVELIADRIVEEVAKPHEPPADDVRFGCYLGIAVFPIHGEAREELLGNADIALSAGEASGKPYVIYTDEMGRTRREQERLVHDLSSAIDEGFEQFEIVYQPFVDTNGKIVGAESLMRWNHPELGNIPPSVFIPVAERTGAIRILGQWSLYHSCKRLKAWHRDGYNRLFISVNLSAYQFKQQDLVVRIGGILEALKMKGECLKLELTESMVMEDPEDAIAKMKELKKLGIRLSIDDFGTGYSSLTYLQRFPIDTLKIDRSFVKDSESNVHNQEIIKAIISLARNIHVDTLAEGAETHEQVDFLFHEGCDNIQGYYFSKPVGEGVFSSYLERGGSLPCQ